MAAIYYPDGAGGELRFDVPADATQVTLGRGKKSDLRIRHDNLSRQHARLLIEAGSYSMLDLGSTNGTFVNGERLSPDTPQPVQHGDELKCGEITMRFEAEELSDAPGAGPPAAVPPAAIPPAAAPPPAIPSVAVPPAPVAPPELTGEADMSAPPPADPFGSDGPPAPVPPEPSAQEIDPHEEIDLLDAEALDDDPMAGFDIPSPSEGLEVLSPEGAEVEDAADALGAVFDGPSDPLDAEPVEMFSEDVVDVAGIPLTDDAADDRPETLEPDVLATTDSPDIQRPADEGYVHEEKSVVMLAIGEAASHLFGDEDEQRHDSSAIQIAPELLMDHTAEPVPYEPDPIPPLPDDPAARADILEGLAKRFRHEVVEKSRRLVALQRAAQRDIETKRRLQEEKKVADGAASTRIEELERSQMERETLRQDVERLNGLLAAGEEGVSAVESQLQQTRGELDEVRGDRDARSREVDNLTEELSSRPGRAAVDELEARVQDLEGEVDVLTFDRDSLRQLAGRAEDMEIELRAMRREAGGGKGREGILQKQLKDTEAEFKKARDTAAGFKNKARQTFDRLAETLRALEAEKLAVEERAAERAEEGAHEAEDREADQAKIRELEEDYEAIVGERDELKAQLAEAGEQGAHEAEDREADQDQIRELEESLEALVSERDELKTQVAETGEQADQAEAAQGELTDLRAELESLDSERAELKEQLDALGRGADAAQGQTEQAETRIAELEAQVEDSELQRKEAEQRTAELESQLEESEAQGQDAVQQSEGRTTELESQLEESKSQAEELTQQLSESEARASSSETQGEELKARVEGLEEEVRRYQDDAADTSSADIIEELRKSLEETRGSFEEQQAESQQLKSDLDEARQGVEERDARLASAEEGASAELSEITEQLAQQSEATNAAETARDVAVDEAAAAQEALSAAQEALAQAESATQDATDKAESAAQEAASKVEEELAELREASGSSGELLAEAKAEAEQLREELEGQTRAAEGAEARISELNQTIEALRLGTGGGDGGGGGGGGGNDAQLLEFLDEVNDIVSNWKNSFMHLGNFLIDVRNGIDVLKDDGGDPASAIEEMESSGSAEEMEDLLQRCEKDARQLKRQLRDVIDERSG